MKTKLIMLGIGVAAALCGFWAGSYRTRHEWEQTSEWLCQQQNYHANRGRAATAASVLSRLADAKDSEARDMLEWQLDLGIHGMLSYLSNYWRAGGAGADSRDATVIDQARLYRSQHPWTNSPNPNLSEFVRKALNKPN
jgi:hypothetical protein